MKRVGILLAAGLLVLGGSVARAAEEGVVHGTLKLAPAPAPSCCAAAPCAAASCGAGCQGHLDHFCAWLLYKPARAHCACQHAITPCVPPLYTWFLDMCPEGGCGACGSHGGHATPCADGGCGARSH